VRSAQAVLERGWIGVATPRATPKCVVEIFPCEKLLLLQAFSECPTRAETVELNFNTLLHQVPQALRTPMRELDILSFEGGGLPGEPGRETSFPAQRVFQQFFQRLPIAWLLLSEVAHRSASSRQLPDIWETKSSLLPPSEATPAGPILSALMRFHQSLRPEYLDPPLNRSKQCADVECYLSSNGAL
jgi:hypothetical protein